MREEQPHQCEAAKDQQGPTTNFTPDVPPPSVAKFGQLTPNRDCPGSALPLLFRLASTLATAQAAALAATPWRFLSVGADARLTGAVGAFAGIVLSLIRHCDLLDLGC
jgi:hypothetical protein